MTAMAWLGNMRQRFEELCQEVDETIYEDTVNYVENQMKTVKKTVKNFYTEVMQDLADSSSPNVAEEKYAPVAVTRNGDAAICEKPQVDKNSESVDAASKQITGESDVAGDADKCVNHGPCHSVEVQCSSENSESQFTDMVSNQSTTVENNCNSRQELDPLLKSLSEFSSKDLVEECTDCNSRHERDECLCGLGISGDRYSHLSSSVKVSQSIENEVEVPQNILDGCAGTKQLDDTVPSMKAVVGTTITDTNVVDAENEFYLSVSGNQRCLELEESCVLVERNDQFLRSFVRDVHKSYKLDESCVQVEKNDQFSRSSVTDVRKSYKKKIREAFSRRRWSRKSLSYTSTKHSKIENSETSDTLESEWELL